jgi:hypothetical protein
MAERSLADIDAEIAKIEQELQNKGEVTSTESVMMPSNRGEFSKFAESYFKGIPKGVIDIAGGWGNLYDYLAKSKDPSALSTAGIANGLKKLTGVDISSIPGYEGVYQFTRAATPAGLFAAAGIPGMLPRSAGAGGEFVAGGTLGLTTQQIAPDSPLAQVAMGMAPYAVAGGGRMLQRRMLTPEGKPGTAAMGGSYPTVEQITELQRVGRLTPGEASMLREQLGKESAVAASVKSGEKPAAFRVGQAQDAESFLTKLFDRASMKAVAPGLSPTAVTETVVTAFNNYGKALTGKLRSDAKKDFTAAKVAGGEIDTTPILSVVENQLARIPPEAGGDLNPLRRALTNIRDEYAIPEVATKVEPSAVLGPTGQPARVNITPGTPAQAAKIDVDRLQKNLAVWGDAAYSGKADFGKGNIFEGVAPGQAKGIALSVLNGFRDSLTQAIDSGVPGADKLKKARDNFATNIKQIEQFSDRPLTKAFDVNNVTDLVPEKVMADLRNMPPSQRAFLIDVMQKSPNANVFGVLNTVRQSTFDDILQSAQVSGAGAKDPTFAIGTALRELSDKKSQFASLFPNASDLADAKLALQYMQRVVTTEGAAPLPSVKGGAAYATARGMGASAQQAMLVREAAPSIVKDLIASPAALADVFFNPEGKAAILALARGKTTGQKAVDAINTLSKIAGTTALRAGPMISGDRPVVGEEQQMAPPPERTLEDIDAEIRALEAQ